MLAAIGGCDGPGILYTLATESPRSNRNLPDELTVTAVVSAGSHFYVAAGGMWRRPHAGDSWQPVTRPEQLLVLGLAAAGDTLCAGTVRGVYRAQAGESPNWGRASGVPATEQVLRVFTISGTADETEILAVTHPRENETAYRVYRSLQGCSNFEPLEVLEDVSRTSLRRHLRVRCVLGDGWRPAVSRSGAGRPGSRGRAARRLRPAARGVPQRRRRPVVRGRRERRDSLRRGRRKLGFGADRTSRRRRGRRAAHPVHANRRHHPDRNQGVGFYRFEDGAPDRAERGPRITSQLYEAHITGFAPFEYFDGARTRRIVFAGAAVAGLSSLKVDEVDGNFDTWDWE